jgi:hypothetical protein
MVGEDRELLEFSSGHNKGRAQTALHKPKHSNTTSYDGWYMYQLNSS